MYLTIHSVNVLAGRKLKQHKLQPGLPLYKAAAVYLWQFGRPDSDRFICLRSRLQNSRRREDRIKYQELFTAFFLGQSPSTQVCVNIYLNLNYILRPNWSLVVKMDFQFVVSSFIKHVENKEDLWKHKVRKRKSLQITVHVSLFLLCLFTYSTA